MKCEKIRELILTDYTDGEADKDTADAVRSHIAACERCRRFEEGLKTGVKDIFASAERIAPPPSVWEGIRRRIAEGEISGENKVLAAWRRIPEMLRVARPALALSAAAVALIAILFVARLSISPNGGVNSYLADQANFISGFDNGEGDDGEGDDGGLGTAIEEYLFM